MIYLWRCEICGDPYIGGSPPRNCPFCGAKQKYIKIVKKAKVNWDVELNETDKTNVERALQVELSNAAFYGCAEKKTDDEEGKLLFKILKKVEAEHASIWRKILKLEKTDSLNEECFIENNQNLEESHRREEKAIAFYRKAEKEATNKRVKEIFKALIEVEEDHLKLSEQRLKKLIQK